ncbi:MAG TPA: hypothetical protein PLL00_07815 [Bacteroidia bacterium]|nr:hypothetical protein [Bacteroidia bacterium]
MTVKIKPNLITHIRGKNGDLESEKATLYEKLYHSHDFESFAINFNKSHPKHKDRRKLRDDINKFKNGSADDIYTEKIPLHYKY